MELKVTRYEIGDAGIGTIWLHRPERRNSWTGRMHAEYRWVCRRLDDDPAVRVIVLTGSGHTFCIGADPKALSGYVEADHYDPARPGRVTVSARSSTRTWPGSSACARP
jgi:enoyl-CoA hydratase/carnithine racemase